MKKTKIIIGALMLAAFFSVNAFAQEQNGPSKRDLRRIGRFAKRLNKKLFFPTPSLPDNELEKLAKATDKLKKAAERKDPTVTIHTKDFYLGNTLATDSGSQVFKVLLTKRLKNLIIHEENKTWKEDGVEFKLRLEYPYLYIKVTQPENQNKMVRMTLEDYHLMTALIGVSSKELSLYYVIDDMPFTKSIGVSFFANPLPMPSVDIALNQTFTVKDNFSGKIDTNINFAKSKRKEFFFQDRYFTISADIQKNGKMHIAFANQNPLVENVPVMLAEENENIYCIYTLKEGDNKEEKHTVKILNNGFLINKNAPAPKVKSLLGK